MRNKDEEQDVSSLIPGVREQETCLQEAFLKAQRDGDESVKQARQEAEASLDKLRLEFSSSVERLREKELGTLSRELEAEQADKQEAIQARDETVSVRMPAAVQYILNRVLPEGTA